jgi:hypothetical protein
VVSGGLSDRRLWSRLDGGEWGVAQTLCAKLLYPTELSKTDLANVDFLVEIVNNYNGFDNYLSHSYNNVPLGPDTTVDHIAWQLDDPSQGTLQR